MRQNYCSKCGCKLVDKELKNEGKVPYCMKCKEYRFPVYNVAVSIIVINEATQKILLIQQYGRQSNILVAGYVNCGEKEEDAVLRELKEETGMAAERIEFNRTEYYEPSNTLMCNFTAYVKDDSELKPNEEIDSYHWYSFEDAKREIKKGSLAEKFLVAFLDD